MRNQQIPTANATTRINKSITYGLRRKNGSRLAGKRHLKYEMKYLHIMWHYIVQSNKKSIVQTIMIVTQNAVM